MVLQSWDDLLSETAPRPGRSCWGNTNRPARAGRKNGIGCRGSANKKPGSRTGMSNGRASSVIGYRLAFTPGHCDSPQYHIVMTRNPCEFSAPDARASPLRAALGRPAADHRAEVIASRLTNLSTATMANTSSRLYCSTRSIIVCSDRRTRELDQHAADQCRFAGSTSSAVDCPWRPNPKFPRRAMNDDSQKARERLEAVLNSLLCPITGCWPLHGCHYEYYFDADADSARSGDLARWN